MAVIIVVTLCHDFLISHTQHSEACAEVMASLIDVETSDVVTDETVEIPAGTTKEFSIDISSVDTSEAMGITVIRIGSMKPENVKATLIREDGSTDEVT